jgi:hypothetical protein
LAVSSFLPAREQQNKNFKKFVFFLLFLLTLPLKSNRRNEHEEDSNNGYGLLAMRSGRRSTI